MADTAGKVFPIYNNKFEFGTNGFGSTDGQMVTPANLESFALPTDGTMEEWFATGAAGWAKATMTSKKLSSSFKGK